MFEWQGTGTTKDNNLKLWYQFNNSPVDNKLYPGYEGHENDLVAWYKFDGDLTADSTSNNNTLTNNKVNIIYSIY